MSKGISLVGPSFKLDAPADIPAFLRALSDLFPIHSTLYLEGNPLEEIDAYLNKRKASVISKVAIGTLWPRQKCYHIEITRLYMEGLAELTKGIGTPNITTHLHVYKDNQVLLQWYDAFTQPLFLSQQVPKERIERFCQQLGIRFLF